MDRSQQMEKIAIDGQVTTDGTCGTECHMGTPRRVADIINITLNSLVES
jgi:hypothetical protein